MYNKPVYTTGTEKNNGFLSNGKTLNKPADTTTFGETKCVLITNSQTNKM